MFLLWIICLFVETGFCAFESNIFQAGPSICEVAVGGRKAVCVVHEAGMEIACFLIDLMEECEKVAVIRMIRRALVSFPDHGYMNELN